MNCDEVKTIDEPKDLDKKNIEKWFKKKIIPSSGTMVLCSNQGGKTQAMKKVFGVDFGSKDKTTMVFGHMDEKTLIIEDVKTIEGKHMSDNIQKQTWTITFDADEIPWDDLAHTIKCLRGIKEVQHVPIESECNKMVMYCESLEKAIQLFKESAKMFKDKVKQ